MRFGGRVGGGRERGVANNRVNSHVGEVHILVVVRALMVFDNIMVVWGVVACLVVVVVGWDA